MMRSTVIAVALLLTMGPAHAASSSDSLRQATLSPRADVLYNAGTEALDRGDVGPAVAFLAAAARLEPRARDIQVNLTQATAAAARARGVESQDEIDIPRDIPLATDEMAWIGAILLALGAAGGIAVRVARVPRPVAYAAIATVIAGVAIHAWLLARAHAEAVHPEAVVVARQLAVERGSDEPSRAPVILGAGERVRLGQVRGGQVEIRVAGTVIGWAAREGLWRVQETPRYTARYATP
ncbi:MAG TPA: hypothetical protein VFT97_05980 [Candidatus Eisenbacteria bacterium]|nr:hypothetical protein [Candidatus Eisenbacteria bacterium]